MGISSGGISAGDFVRSLAGSAATPKVHKTKSVLNDGRVCMKGGMGEGGRECFLTWPVGRSSSSYPDRWIEGAR